MLPPTRERKYVTITDMFILQTMDRVFGIHGEGEHRHHFLKVGQKQHGTTRDITSAVCLPTRTDCFRGIPDSIENCVKARSISLAWCPILFLRWGWNGGSTL